MTYYRILRLLTMKQIDTLLFLHLTPHWQPTSTHGARLNQLAKLGLLEIHAVASRKRAIRLSQSVRLTQSGIAFLTRYKKQRAADERRRAAMSN